MTLPDHATANRPRPSVITGPFVLAIVLLGTSAILAGPVASRLKWRQEKKAIPLTARLSDLDADALFPYVLKREINLEPAFVEALGTDEYLQWQLEDTSAAADDPVRFANLFVTYYTGGANLVPHTPDVCYLGSGYNPSRAHENIEVAVPALSGASREVPVRVCSFVKTAIFHSRETTVVYTFFCNGKFAATRTGVRILINDPSAAHAYFSKIEVSFPGFGQVPGADRATTVEGAGRVLNKVLPVLIRNHFPDFEAVESAYRGS